VRVSRAGGYGYYTVLYHHNGLFSLYSHALKKKRLSEGQQVSRGETIAYMGKSGNARGYHLHLELIDLREHWNLEESLENFIQKIVQGEPLTASECGQLNKLLFSKKCKTDPLQIISGLAFAKRINGKWVAAEPAVRQTTHAQATKNK